MAGTAKTYTVAEMMRGPGDFWLDTEVPASGATPGRLTIAADLTPDATASPTASHLGMTPEGTEMSLKYTVEEEFVDEFPAPVRTTIVGEEAHIVQILNLPLLIAMTQNLSTLKSGSGYKQATFGGKVTITPKSVALIAQIPGTDAAPKAQVFQLYSAINEAGFDYQITRKKRAEASFDWKGYAVPGRTQGDQMGSYWIQT
jgi:hypothetical protein